MVPYSFIQTLRIQKSQIQIFVAFVSSLCQTKTKAKSQKNIQKYTFKCKFVKKIYGKTTWSHLSHTIIEAYK